MNWYLEIPERLVLLRYPHSQRHLNICADIHHVIIAYDND
nr:B362 [uncultured bacterium]